MDFKLIDNLANSEVTFAILFVAGLVFIGRWFINQMEEQKKESDLREAQIIEIYKEQLKDSSHRERELMSHLSKNTEQLKNIADTLEGVQSNLQKLERRVNDDLRTVWKELGAKADKIELLKQESDK